MEHAIGHILTAVLLGLLALLFRSKDTQLNSIQILRLEELIPKFEKSDNLYGILLVFMGWPLLTIMFGGFIWGISQLFYTKPSNAIFYFSAFVGDDTWITCMTVGLVLAIGFSIPLLNSYLQNKYAQDFDLYLVYMSKRFGFNHLVFSKVWSLFFLVVALIYLILLDNWFFIVNENNIEYNKFLSLKTETYTIGDLRKLTYSTHSKAMNNELVLHKRYEILFKSGQSWILDDWLKADVPNDSVINYLVDKTKIKLQVQQVADW